MKPWNNRPPDSDFYQQNAYPLANVVNHKPRRRLNNTTIVCAIVFVAWALAMIF